jgi:iron complex outermembrane receptor protein
LRDALDRLAAAARIRLSYASELLPLDRRVCLFYRGVAIGEALNDLLNGTAVEPVATGGELVVLAPARGGVTPMQRVSTVRRTTSILDRIVVTGSAAGAAERSQTVALDVLHGDELTRRGATTLAAALSGTVPGIWMWAQPPSRLSARYGSIRGASSFGVSYPKIYIDGVEVANPLILTDIDPEVVERVEVIRGPQGAALYGSDAISGVINILLRHDGIGPSGDRLQLRTSAGVSGSDFASHDVLAQEHTLLFRTGTSTRSAGLGMRVRTLGEFVPGAYSRRGSANGDMRMIGAHSSLTMSGRLSSERVGAPHGLSLTPASQPQLAESPLPHMYWRGRFDSHSAPDSGQPPPPSAFDSTAPQTVRHYTIGTTAAIMPDARWTHTAVIGLDGYRLANVAVDGGPIPTPADSALLAARGSADRASVRLSSVARFGTDDRRSGSLTFALDHSRLHETTAAGEMHFVQSGGGGPGGGGPGPGPGPEVEELRSSANRTTTGATSQVDLSFRNRLFVTGGLRLERTSGFTARSQVSTLPLLGAAFVIDNGRTTLKLRSAYGKGIRPARTTVRATGWTLWQPGSAAQDLAPEEQVGVEVGADLLLHRIGTLRVTRFDQQASGLIQPVVVSGDTRFDGSSHYRRVGYQLQNVGEIGNSGWEMEGSLVLGRLALGSALAFVDSRVERTASGYTGDLRVGDRVLEVPKRTTSLNATWLGGAWSTGLTLARASNWINYDREALNQAVLSPDRSIHDFVGATLRSFWHEYNGVTRLNATFSRDFSRGVSFLLSGDNLLGYQEGEPDNVTVLPGRTVIAGLRLRF